MNDPISEGSLIIMLVTRTSPIWPYSTLTGQTVSSPQKINGINYIDKSRWQSNTFKTGTVLERNTLGYTCTLTSSGANNAASLTLTGATSSTVTDGKLDTTFTSAAALKI